MFFKLENRWGPITIDHFASHLNTKKNRFNSYHFCPNSEAIDCFTQDWAKEVNYACSPFGLVHRVLTHSRESKAVVILILPAWVLALWWPIFLGAPKKVIELPLASEIIVPGPLGQREPCKNPTWKLLAARIVWSKYC